VVFCKAHNFVDFKESRIEIFNEFLVKFAFSKNNNLLRFSFSKILRKKLANSIPEKHAVGRIRTYAPKGNLIA
jgi:hypothetical protein